MTHVTELLSAFAAALRFEDLPADVVEATKLYILDYYAASLAGIRVNGDFNRAMEEILLDMGGKEEADYLLSERRIPSMNAAFMNAVYAHGADMDDGNRKAMGHIGAHVIAAVLTLAQTLPVTGRDVITAVNVGYEVYNRVAAAAQPELVHRGFHSTGTAGAVACGAACGKLMGLGKAGIYSSMSIAALQASGLFMITESGQNCKPINPANAARTGILSAKLAAGGVEGPRFPLESKKGWFQAMCGEPEERRITEGLGREFTILESYLKPYPACRHTHCGIEAALDIRRQLEPGERIRAVRVYIYPNAIAIAGQIREPATPDDSKFSIHYALACALVRGRFGLSDLDPSADPAVRDIISRTELIPDETMEDRDAGIRGARVQVETESGQCYERTVLIPKGDGANPFTLEELREKLRDCAEDLLDEAACETLVKNVMSLDRADRIASIALYR